MLSPTQLTCKQSSGNIDPSFGSLKASAPRVSNLKRRSWFPDISIYHFIFSTCLLCATVLFVASFIPYYSAKGREIEKCRAVIYTSRLCDDGLVSLLYGSGDHESAKVLSDIEIERLRYKGSVMSCEGALLCAQENQTLGALRDWYNNGPIHVVLNASTWEMKLAYIVLSIVFVWKMADGLKVTQILKRLSKRRRNVIEVSSKRHKDIAVMPAMSSK